MTPTLLIIAAVTIGLLGASVWLSRRGRDGSNAIDGTAFPEPTLANPTTTLTPLLNRPRSDL